jgi:hypothetical protein
MQALCRRLESAGSVRQPATVHRRLHRRKSFWLGLFVLLFFGWAWRDSIHRAHILRIGSPLAPGCLVLWQSRGSLGVGRYHLPSGETLICNELLAGTVTGPASLWRDRHGNPRFSLPTAASGTWVAEGWGVSAAHWLLMLLVAAGLSMWIRRRSRCEKRHANLLLPLQEPEASVRARG